MSAITIWRGFDFDLYYTAESAPGTAADISGYDQCRIDIDDAKGAVDKLTVNGTIEQAGAVNKGLMKFPFTNAATAGWSGDLKIRAQVRLRVTGSSPAKWHNCEGPDPVLLRDRVADTLT